MPVSSVAAGDLTFLGQVGDKVKKNLEVSTETFLKLLVAQYQFQDPMEPQSNADFIAQLAQMTSLQEMQTMAQTLSNTQTYSMIGKYIYAEVPNAATGETEHMAGFVDSVVIKNNKPYVVLGEQAIPAEYVKQVFDGNMFQADTSLVSSSNLIGKFITAEVTVDGAPAEASGVVRRVAAENGVIYAYIGDNGDYRVVLNNITSISELSGEEALPEQDDTPDETGDPEDTEPDAGDGPDNTEGP